MTTNEQMLKKILQDCNRPLSLFINGGRVFKAWAEYMKTYNTRVHWQKHNFLQFSSRNGIKETIDTRYSKGCLRFGSGLTVILCLPVVIYSSTLLNVKYYSLRSKY